MNSDLKSLNDSFGIENILAFEPHGELIRARITTPGCTAELYLQGAQLTQWQPAGHEQVLFLSERSAFVPGKAIRGGVPIVFPWFGARTANACTDRTDGPAHGFARIAEWTLAFAALSGDDLHLTLTLGPDDNSRALGYDRFQLVYELTLGAELQQKLTVANVGDAPLCFEEALHSYFYVGDVQQVGIIGLGDCNYLDKMDGFQRKHQKDALLQFKGAIDRPYLDTRMPINIDDIVLKRRITVDKANSKTTVVWNPWSELCATLTDMEPNGWLTMACIETANAATNIITLAPGEHHRMEAHIFVQKIVELPQVPDVAEMIAK